jgi:hypothetical protein
MHQKTWSQSLLNVTVLFTKRETKGPGFEQRLFKMRTP